LSQGNGGVVEGQVSPVLLDIESAWKLTSLDILEEERL
jgi:hypothetical protein